MHLDEWDEVALAVQQWRRQTPRCVGGAWFFIVTSSVVAACIYMEDPLRVTASCNQLGLSLSKHIRHGFVAKNKQQKKATGMRGFGSDFGGPFTRTSCVRTHRLATPRRANARVFLSFSSIHSCKCIEINSHFKLAFLYLH
jgi:hypothetical protein